jgi:hypothetical protein
MTVPADFQCVGRESLSGCHHAFKHLMSCGSVEAILVDAHVKQSSDVVCSDIEITRAVGGSLWRWREYRLRDTTISLSIAIQLV